MEIFLRRGRKERNKKGFVMSKWTIGWILWILMFFALELPAIFNTEKNDTFTEHVTTYLPMEVAVAVYGALALWIPVHFFIWYRNRKRSKELDD